MLSRRLTELKDQSKHFFHKGLIMDDSKIVDLFLARDELAIVETKSKYGHMLIRIIYSVVQDLCATEECENDTYLEGWNRIPPHEPREYLFPFFAKIARHISIDRIRKENSKKRNGFVVELSEEIEQFIPQSISVEKIVENQLIIEALNEWVKALPKYKRMIFIRRYFYMDSIHDISEQSGYSESKVKSILSRMRRAAFEYLAKRGYEK